MSYLLAEVLPHWTDQLEWLACRVAFNRERAGVHYPSDSAAGKVIARVCVDLIKDRTLCPETGHLFDAVATEWAASVAPNTVAQLTNEPFPNFPPP
jgi:hypothetical protein